MRFARILVLAFLAAAAFVATATDAPHDLSAPVAAVNCQSCHQGHNAPGGALTKRSGNVNLCQSCHSPDPPPGPTGHGFPWLDTEQANFSASPVTGTSHRWDALATNRGATAPASGTPMGIRLDVQVDGPHLTCSVCHDQHNNTGRVGGGLYTSIALNTPIARTSGSGTGTLQLTSVPTGAMAGGYVIKISSTTTFKISHDNGLSYLGYNGALTPKWDLDTNAGYTAGKTFGVGVTLDDELTQMTFTGTFDAVAPVDIFAGFYVGYPFLRISNQASEMCVTCHPERNQSRTRVIGQDGSYVPDGTKMFHHPVNESLNTNGGGYDRGNAASSSVLDANGAVQPNDGIASNDIRLGTNNSVQCLSCHSPHNADSNSLTEIPIP